MKFQVRRSEAKAGREVCSRSRSLSLARRHNLGQRDEHRATYSTFHKTHSSLSLLKASKRQRVSYTDLHSPECLFALAGGRAESLPEVANARTNSLRPGFFFHELERKHFDFDFDFIFIFICNSSHHSTFSWQRETPSGCFARAANTSAESVQQ